MDKKAQEFEILNINQTEYTTRLSKKFKQKGHYMPPDISKVNCFIPGTIVEVLVDVGDEVNEGDDLLVLEAMKMKNRIKSPASGKIRRVNVTEGERVAKGHLLIVLI